MRFSNGTGDSGINGWITSFKDSAHVDSEAIKTAIGNLDTNLPSIATEITGKLDTNLEDLKKDYNQKFTNLQNSIKGNAKISPGEGIVSTQSLVDDIKTSLNTFFGGNTLSKLKEWIDGAAQSITKGNTNDTSATKKVEDDTAAKKAAEEAAAKKAKDQSAATDVIGKIKAIGTVAYNDDIKTKKEAARKAYDALTADQKKLVTNYSTLTDAEKKYSELKTADDAAKKKAAEEAAAKKKAKDDLNKQITNQNNKIKDIEAKMNTAYSKANDAAQVRKSFESELKSIKEQLRVAERSIALQSQLPGLHAHRQGIEKNIRDYDVRYDTYIKQYNDYKKQLEAEKANLQKLQTQLKSLATGTKRFGKNGLAWTNENLKNGSELIIRPSDGAILTPLKANDAVIPANLANNLFKWGAINPDSFAVNPFMGKWGESIGGNNNSDILSNNTTNQSIEMHFDSLITVQGNVDADVVSRLEDLSKNLTSNKDFQKNVIKFVTKDFVRESKKQGIR